MNSKKYILSLILVAASVAVSYANAAQDYDPMRSAIKPRALPPRAPHVITDFDTEAQMHSYRTKGAPGAPLVANTGARRSQAISKTKLEGTLKKGKSVGLYEIEYLDVVLANIDWRDRGDRQHADRLMDSLVGTKVTANCHVRLSNGPLVCEVTGEIEGKSQDAGAYILGKGWLGWQTEVGAFISPAAQTRAKEAYWAGLGVWSNPWYFPDGSFRNAYVSQK